MRALSTLTGCFSKEMRKEVVNSVFVYSIVWIYANVEQSSLLVMAGVSASLLVNCNLRATLAIRFKKIGCKSKADSIEIATYLLFCFI